MLIFSVMLVYSVMVELLDKRTFVGDPRGGFKSLGYFLLIDETRGKQRLWDEGYIEKMAGQLLEFEAHASDDAKLAADTFFSCAFMSMELVEKPDVGDKEKLIEVTNQFIDTALGYIENR